MNSENGSEGEVRAGQITQLDLAFCIQKVAPPGSAMHYAALLVDEPHRAQVLAFHTLQHELHEMVMVISDNAVARRKLGWWAEELQETLDGRASHPVTRQLRAALGKLPTARALVHAMVSATGVALESGEFESGAAYRTYVEETAGNTERLIAELVGYSNHETPTICADIGVGRALLARLVAGVLDRGRAAQTPGGETMEENAGPLKPGWELPVEAPARDGRAAGLAETLELQAQEIKTLLASGNALDAADQRRHRSRLALSGMDLAVLNKLERAGWRARARSTSLSPLTRLWITWRTDRRYR